MELRTVLRVVHQAHLAGGHHLATEVTRDEGRTEAGEGQTGLGTILDVVLVLIAAQPLDGLEGAAKLHPESLSPTEHVPVLIRSRKGCSEVTGRVGTLYLHAETVVLALRHLHHSIEPGAVRRRRIEAHIGAQHPAQPDHAGIGLLHILLAIDIARLQSGSFAQRPWPVRVVST